MTSLLALLTTIFLASAAAVAVASRFVKPRLEAPVRGFNRIVLLGGLPFCLGLSVFSLFVYVDREPLGPGNTLVVEGKIVDHVDRDDFVDLILSGSDLKYRVGSSYSHVFDYKGFAADFDESDGISCILRVDKTTYLLAKGEASWDEVGLLNRPDLIFHAPGQPIGFVWVYEVRSNDRYYLEMKDAEKAQRRQYKVLIFFVVPGFLAAFVFTAIIVAGMLRQRE